MIPDILLTLFLVALNGFFVAAEFAIVKVRSSQIEVKAVVNKRLSAAAKKIVVNLDAYLAATQLGITLASLGLGWVGEKVVASVILRIFNALHLNLSEATAKSVALPVAFITITILHIVFGELAPKSIAIRHPTTTTFALAWPLRIFYFIFRPFIWTLNGFANFLLRLIGIKPMHGSEIHTEEELKMIITESQEGGAIEETERELIQNVFDFDDRRVADIQTLRKNVTALHTALTVREAIDIAVTEGYSRYPVYTETIDDITGIIHTKDLMKRYMEDGGREAGIIPLIRKAYFIPGSMKIKDLLKDFQKKHIQMAIVTNEIGDVAGIVTMEDILEELVGEIQDEYDNEKPYVERTGDNTFIITAHRNLSDINKYLPYRLEESEHYDTLSGLIAYLFSNEIREGDVLPLGAYEARILKMYRNSVETLELKLPDEQDDAS